MPPIIPDPTVIRPVIEGWMTQLNGNAPLGDDDAAKVTLGLEAAPERRQRVIAPERRRTQVRMQLVGVLTDVDGVVQRAGEILHQLESSSGKAVRINPESPRQLALFPETNPLREELSALDLNALSPIEALNKIYEWKMRYTDKKPG